MLQNRLGWLNPGSKQWSRDWKGPQGPWGEESLWRPWAAPEQEEQEEETGSSAATLETQDRAGGATTSQPASDLGLRRRLWKQAKSVCGPRRELNPSGKILDRLPAAF